MRLRTKLYGRLCLGFASGITLAILVYGCHSQTSVTVPVSDSTPPTVTMTVHFGRSGALQQIQLNDQSSPPSVVHLHVGDEVVVFASGSDPDGGLKDIEIDPDITTSWKVGSDTASQSNGLRVPVDNPSNAQVGGSTSVERSVSYTYDIPDPRTQLPAGATDFRIEGRIHATASNFHGGSTPTREFQFTYP